MAPTPTIWRATSSPRSFVIDTVTAYSHAQDLDARGALDVALDFAADRDAIGPNGAGELGSRVDREVALNVHVTLEPPRDSNVARAIDLARDCNVRSDDGLLRLARRRAPSRRRYDIRGGGRDPPLHG